ncbi:MAG TPA: glycosyl hydrolase [Bacteroidia bacterium]|nr:glycosyl hydrolase [Bacteroidia bacterium]
MVKNIFYTALIGATLLFASTSKAQKKKGVSDFPLPSTSQTREDAFEQRKKLNSTSLLNNVKLKNVGPTLMAGRVVDIDVSPYDATQFYVAFASGGLWKTTNNGNTFTPLFDNEAVMTIGDIAVDWQHGEILYVGTGENNSSRSSYSGVGVYKSRDKGKTWQHIGLPNTQHIGRIIIHPTQPNTIWVAALGHLYTANDERGIFKSTDGGATWKHTLFVNDNTGAIDLIIDAKNENILYTSMWHRERRAWNFTESGSSSGIYKSIDGGNIWKLVSGAQSGFPQGEGIGRIGLAISATHSNIVYAVLDNQTRRPKKPEEALSQNKILSRDTLRQISKETFLQLSDKQIDDYLDENNFPEKYNAASVKKMVRENKITPSALVEYLEDANSLLFDTDVTGGEVYRSDDAGTTWKKQNEKYIEELFNTYGYYFGQIKISPFNDDEIYLPGFQILKSTNGGKTFSSILADNVHVDFHSIYINPNREGHIILANDGGLNVSYDSGATYVKCNTPPVGQFYSINFDYQTPFNLYGGLQDNGVWQWQQNKADYGYADNNGQAYKALMGGDGMQIQIDTRDDNIAYTGYQFGNYYRINIATGDQKYITPQVELGERPLRWNWQTPILISKHQGDIIYMGANKLYRSMNKGDTWKAISNDLTLGGIKGDVPYGTITCIDESSLRFGLLYTGSDDGLIHVSKDGGNTWKKISDGLPQKYWVSRVAASSHVEGRVYVSLNGYRFDNFSAFIFVSNDYGNTWQPIGKDLPAEPVNVIKEDPANENIIYAGTDHGLYVSLNGGKTFMQWKNEMPAVPIHDLAIHPRDKKILIGTHGRSAFIGDVSLIQQLYDTLINKPFYVFDIENKKHSSRWGQKQGEYEPVIKPSQSFAYYAGKSGIVKLQIKADDLLLSTVTDTCEQGINFIDYHFTFDSTNVAAYTLMVNKNKTGDEKIILKKADDGNYYLQPGKFTLVFTGPKNENIIKEFEIKARERKSRSQQ